MSRLLSFDGRYPIPNRKVIGVNIPRVIKEDIYRGSSSVIQRAIYRVRKGSSVEALSTAELKEVCIATGLRGTAFIRFSEPRSAQEFIDLFAEQVLDEGYSRALFVKINDRELTGSRERERPFAINAPRMFANAFVAAPGPYRHSRLRGNLEELFPGQGSSSSTGRPRTPRPQR